MCFPDRNTGRLSRSARGIFLARRISLSFLVPGAPRGRYLSPGTAAPDGQGEFKRRHVQKRPSSCRHKPAACLSESAFSSGPANALPAFDDRSSERAARTGKFERPFPVPPDLEGLRAGTRAPGRSRNRRPASRRTTRHFPTDFSFPSLRARMSSTSSKPNAAQVARELVQESPDDAPGQRPGQSPEGDGVEGKGVAVAAGQLLPGGRSSPFRGALPRPGRARRGARGGGRRRDRPGRRPGASRAGCGCGGCGGRGSSRPSGTGCRAGGRRLPSPRARCRGAAG